MRNLLWAIAAHIATRPAIAEWIIRRAQRTPYSPIEGPDGSTYMGRWWLFNPYGKGPDGEILPARWQWLPSVRVHHIMRPDSDRHLHDHPWNARTIVLRGWYTEERPTPEAEKVMPQVVHTVYRREAGYTGRLLFGQYHRIAQVSPGGVWTLFFTWGKQGTWGFDVGGRKVPWREYLTQGAPRG